MMRLVAFIAIAVLLSWPVRALLLSAKWTSRTPRAVIVLWQSIGFASSIALVGACVTLVASSAGGIGTRRDVTDFTGTLVANQPARALSPAELFALTAGLIVATLAIGGLVVSTIGLRRARQHQRRLIDLVGSKSAAVPGAIVLEHPLAVAFSLAGLQPRVVVSSGAIAMLSRDELAAVLAHERAHVRAHHDFVLLPFRAISAVLPLSRVLLDVREEVAGLLEMAADDQACRESAPEALARALCRLATADGEATELPAATGHTTLRVDRALTAGHGSKLLALGSALSACCVLALPFAVLLTPLGSR